MANPVNPKATGGAGTHFEHRVDAFFLAQLLTRGVAPFLPRCVVEGVHLQSGHLMWATDDLLVVACEPEQELRKVAIQVKTGFVLSAKNDDCVETFTRAWQDFSAPDRFDLSRDRLALVTDPASKKLQDGLRGLLDCVRSAVDAADFLRRLALDGYWGKSAQDYGATIRQILDDANGAAVTDDEFWRFLGVFDFAAFDLGTSGSLVEALLLTRLADTGGGGGQAASTWGELIALAGLHAGKGESFRYDKLPSHLRERHQGVVPGSEALRRLRDHAAVVARGVNPRLGAGAATLTLPRSALAAKLLALLEQHRVVLVTGEAGAGKSAVAQGAFQLLRKDAPTWAFRAEEFAHAHLDAAFAPFAVNFEDLRKASLGFPRKVLWIESAERLLEKSTRDAFMDLLGQIVSDPTWRLIVTCRDYSLETVRLAFFERAGLASQTLAVPLLDDQELAECEKHIPALARPLANARLRPFLRNLFVLDKAARLNWQQGAVPADEREFRARVWNELVRREDQAAGAMPTKREEAFIQVALRRARALEPYIDGGDIDPTVVQALRQDGLVASLPGDDAMLAPAHDVLEDWAIMQWLERQYGRHRQNLPVFFSAVGTHPALRRAYRRWLTELLNSTPATADEFAITTIRDSAIPDHWRDDTLVAVLHSAGACGFLERNRAAWRENNLRLLRRIVHLLRVTGKSNPVWFNPGAHLPGTFLTAQGTAWGCLVDIVWQEIAHFQRDDREFLTAFLEDWSSAVSAWIPYPAGFSAAAKLCLHLLPQDEDGWRYARQDGWMERLAKVLLKVPRGAEAELIALVRRLLPTAGWDRWNVSLPALAIDFLHGHVFCRDLPAMAIECAETWLKYEPDSHDPWRGREQIEEAFGLPARLNFGAYPASAWRGPFLSLLRTNPELGVKFVLDFLNRAVSDYANPEKLRGFIEPPVEIALRFPDGSTHKQWANDRLWCLFCGASVGPYVIQSALMALEEWLLGLGDAGDPNLPRRLEEILKTSNSVAVTSVVASVARAFPVCAGPAAVAVLSCLDFYDWDRHRRAHEATEFEQSLSQLMPTVDVVTELFEQERAMARKRSHRKGDLEWLACALQSTAVRDQVLALIDQLVTPLNAEAKNKRNQVQRLLLHRIDSRNWVVRGQTTEGQVQVESTPPAEDIQELIKSSQPDLTRSAQQRSLLFWGLSLFYPRNSTMDADPRVWRARLAEAQHLRQAAPADDDLTQRMEGSAVAFVAAVCAQDYWQEMESAVQVWCAEVLCEAVERDANSTDDLTLAANNKMDGSRPAAYVLGKLLGLDLPQQLAERVRTAFGLALGHMVDEVRGFAASSVRVFLWAQDRDSAVSCMVALVEEVKLVAKLHLAEEAKDHGTQRDWKEIAREAREGVRQAVTANVTVTPPADLAIDLADRYAHGVLEMIFNIIDRHEDDPLTRTFLIRVAKRLVEIWADDPKNGGRRDRSAGRRDRNFELELGAKRQVARFALRRGSAEALAILDPIIEAVPRMGGEVSDFLNLLVGELETPETVTTFWAIWQAVADKFAASPGLSRVEHEDPDVRGLLFWLFLHYGWKQAGKEWEPLHGQEFRIDQLAEKLPTGAEAITLYVRYLHNVGLRALPQGFILLAAKLRALPLDKPLSGDTMLRFEVILGRHVHSSPAALKAKPELREALITLLDLLVERGSSAAFRMRDDFVTPAI